MLFGTISSERSSGYPVLLSTNLIECPAVAFSHCGLLFWVVSSVYFFGCTLGASIFARFQFVFSASSLRWVCSQFWPTSLSSSTNFASVSVCVRDGPNKWSSSWIFAFVSRHFSAIHVVLSSCISSLFCCERVAHVICKIWTVVCGIAAVYSPAAIKLQGKWIWAIFGLFVIWRPSWDHVETTLRPRWGPRWDPRCDQDETNMRFSWDLGEIKLGSIFVLRPSWDQFLRWNHGETFFI